MFARAATNVLLLLKPQKNVDKNLTNLSIVLLFVNVALRSKRLQMYSHFWFPQAWNENK